MSENNIVDFNEALSRQKAEAQQVAADAERTLKGGGGGGTYDGMDARVTALEALAKQTNEKLDKLIERSVKVEVDLARLDGKVSALPSSEAFGHLRGRVDSLPTIPKIAGVFAIVGVLISIASNWDKISAFFN